MIPIPDKYAILYTTNPDKYAPLTHRLEKIGYVVSAQPITDQVSPHRLLDPSIQKSGSNNLWEGEHNLARFVLREERKALPRSLEQITE